MSGGLPAVCILLMCEYVYGLPFWLIFPMLLIVWYEVLVAAAVSSCTSRFLPFLVHSTSSDSQVAVALKSPSILKHVQ